MYDNIVCAGGNTFLPGFLQRFNKDMKSLVPEHVKDNINAIAAPEKKNSVWVGGTVFCSVFSSKFWWVTKKEFSDKGNLALHRKCY